MLLAVLIASWVKYEEGEPFTHGGSPMGLLYGLISLALIVLLMFYGIRKRAYRSRLGKLENWLQSHIYLGVLTFFVILAHTGFRFEDRVATILFVVVTLVIASGILGAVLYKTVPRALTEVESNLTNDEISDQLNQLGKAMARLSSQKSDSFQQIYSRLMSEVKPGIMAGWRLLFRGGRLGLGEQPKDLSAKLALVPLEERDDLRQLLVLSRQQKELHIRLLAQQRYRNILDFWLYLHLPLSIALIALIAAHLWGAFYYGKISWWISR